MVGTSGDSVAGTSVAAVTEAATPSVAAVAEATSVPVRFYRREVMLSATALPRVPISTVVIPKSAKQASTSELASFWQAAEFKELTGIKESGAVEVIPRSAIPANAIVVSSGLLFGLIT